MDEGGEGGKEAELALMGLGGNEETNKEGWADIHLGDRDSVDLVGRQNDLVKAVLETGKPTIVLLINSGPLSINYIARSEEHTSELQSHLNLVCRLLLEKKKKNAV